jgi:AcrR family transcriptional regulator
MPRQAPISREAVLDATLALADVRGLAAVSMRTVATRLGVTPRDLYQHVRDKEDLLDGLVERLLGELPPTDPTLSWEERLHATAMDLRATAARYPYAFGMLFRRPATTPGALRAREAIYSTLRDARVPDALIPTLERLLSTFMIGFAASEAGGRFSAHDRATRDADLEWARSQIARAFQAPKPQNRPPLSDRPGHRSGR